MSRIVRKPDFCLCENKGADQLRGNREADQRLCFRYTDSIFPLLLISEIFFLYPKFQASSLLLRLYSPVCVGPGRKSRRPVFSRRGSSHFNAIEMSCGIRKPTICICKNKGADQLTAQLISVIVFTIQIVESISFNLKFQASSLLL